MEIKSRDRLLKYLVAPAIIFSFVAGVLPMLYALRNSFYNINVRLPMQTERFIGITNYRIILGDNRFLASLRNSIVFSLEGTIGAVLLGLAIALFLYYFLRDKPLLLTGLSTMLLVPALTGRISVAYIWRLLYDPVLGLINHVLELLGFGTVSFLSNNNIAMQSVVFTDVWQWSGFAALFLYAGLVSIPREYFEEAQVIGASFLQRLRYIIIPNIKGLLLAVFLLKFMISLRNFDLISVMTGGGPGTATETVDMYLYWLAVGGRGLLSRASSGAIIMLVITIVSFMIIINLYQKQKVGE